MSEELSPSMIRRINELAVESWSEKTRATQAAGILSFTKHCNNIKVPEERRIPVSAYLLCSFMA
jgi:hypothetical protein